jgi:hypothetical protein
MGTPTIKAADNIAIVWGTENAANFGTNMVGGTMLETLSITPKNGEPVDIEGGAGFAKIQVLVKDGFNARATAVYDSNKAIPAAGANVTLVGPKDDGVNTGTQNYNCTFWTWGFTKSRKKEKLIELFFTHRPDINT